MDGAIREMTEEELNIHRLRSKGQKVKTASYSTAWYMFVFFL